MEKPPSGLSSGKPTFPKPDHTSLQRQAGTSGSPWWTQTLLSPRRERSREIRRERGCVQGTKQVQHPAPVVVLPQQLPGGRGHLDCVSALGKRERQGFLHPCYR